MKKTIILLTTFLFTYLSQAQENILVDNGDIETVLKSFDALQMKDALENTNDQKLHSVSVRNASLISEYVKNKYNIDCNEDGDDLPEATLIFGLFCYGKEKKLGEIPETANASNPISAEVAAGDPLGCLVGAIGGLIGLGEVRSLYNDYVHGVSARTVLRTLRTMVRRVGSIFTIISAVYSFGDCLDWC